MQNGLNFENEDSLSPLELEELERHVRARFQLWRRRTLLVMIAFLLTCVMVYLFLEGSPLHAHWDSVGKYILFLAMALLPVFLYCALLLWQAWRATINKDWSSSEGS